MKMKPVPLDNIDRAQVESPSLEAQGTPPLSNGAWFTCPGAGNSRQALLGWNITQGSRGMSNLGAHKPLPHCPGGLSLCWLWLLSLELHCVEPPPHPAGSGVKAAGRAWLPPLPLLGAPRGSCTTGWSAEIPATTTQTNHIHVCPRLFPELLDSTFKFKKKKSSWGCLVTPEKPRCASEWE